MIHTQTWTETMMLEWISNKNPRWFWSVLLIVKLEYTQFTFNYWNTTAFEMGQCRRARRSDRVIGQVLRGKRVQWIQTLRAQRTIQVIQRAKVYHLQTWLEIMASTISRRGRRGGVVETRGRGWSFRNVPFTTWCTWNRSIGNISREGEMCDLIAKCAVKSTRWIL